MQNHYRSISKALFGTWEKGVEKKRKIIKKKMGGKIEDKVKFVFEIFSSLYSETKQKEENFCKISPLFHFFSHVQPQRERERVETAVGQGF